MACNIDQANEDIDRLLKSSISEDIKQELRVVKEQLTSAKKLKLEENIKSYNDSESIDNTKKDFRSEFKNKRPSAAKWADKEVSKFDVATQAISDGTNNSTAGFVKDFYGDKANTGTYTKDDVIYLSTNGNRAGRVIPVKNGVLQGAYRNIDKAIEAGAKFVADTSKHLASTGKYNVGEVELAEYLQSKGYTREDKDGYGLWSQDNSSIKNDNKPIEIDNSSTDEIISNIYNENNKLQKIGTKEQYLDYIKNKISDSSAKTLLYYGTPIQEKIEKPKQSSSGRYGKGVYLTDSFEEAKLFAYTKDQKDIFGYTDENELPLGKILVGYTTEGNSIEAKQAKGDNDFIEFSSLDSLVTEPHNIEQIRKKENVNLIIGDNGKSFTPSKEFVVDDDSLVILGSLEDVKNFKSNIKTLLVNNDTKTKENKDNKNNISVHKKLDDIVKKYMIDNNLEYDYEIYDVERDEGIIYQLIIKSDWHYDFEVTKDIRKLVHEKLNYKNIIVDDDTIPFSVQQVLEQYKKDENIEKENKKLLEYIQDNVKYEMNYSKQLAYDFFINKRNETGYYNPKLNVVTIADFDGLKNDEDMMRMLSIELINEADNGDKEIKIISDTVKSVINDIDAYNVTFKTKLHEAVHAAVKNYMDSKKGKAYSEEMNKMFEVVKQASEVNPDMFKANKEYWKKDVDEFLAEALSDPEFIKDLMKIDTEGNLTTGAKKSMFDKIIDMVVEALGLSKKEDKLNMHKYLLDSFKAAVEANRDGKEYISSKAPEFNADIDKNLRNILQKIYPEIRLEYTEDEITYKDIDGSIMNQEQYDNKVNVVLKLIDKLYDLGTLKPSKYGGKSQPVRKTVRIGNDVIKKNMEKTLSNRGVPKEQIEMMFDYMEQNDISEIDTLDLAERLMFGLTQSTEIEIATEKIKNKNYDIDYIDDSLIRYNNRLNDELDRKKDIEKNGWIVPLTVMNEIADLTQRIKILEAQKSNVDIVTTSYYSALTVPGGFNYREIEIKTPNVKASIKGHAKFATKEGIGWYRVDDSDLDTGTLRILEMQSDMFQQMKGKDVSKHYNSNIEIYERMSNEDQIAMDNILNDRDIMLENNEIDKLYLEEFDKKIAVLENKYKKKDLNKAFHQILNTDGKWVKFFIQSIIQNSERNGYKNIRFPSGSTIFKIEGYTEEHKSDSVMRFYDNVVLNTLIKTYGNQNIRRVTDEHGNKWFELELDKKRDSQNIMFQKGGSRIKGQADLNSKTVLINSLLQSQDTLPHEYAHHYIHWFRDTSIVQEGIKKFGSEEALVEAIGKDFVKKDGKAWNIWKRFSAYIKNIFKKVPQKTKDELLDELTNSFITRKDIGNKEKSNKAPDGDIKLDKKRYKTINEEDIMQAKDIMLKNKEECR